MKNKHAVTVSLMNDMPKAVFPGASISLQLRVLCGEKCDFEGNILRILDDKDNTVGEAKLLYTSDGTDSVTDSFTVKAPMEAGEYSWKLFYPAQEADGVSHDESQSPWHFIVRPHSISLSVWGIPFPVTRGNVFPIRVSASCPAKCSLAGLPFSISDENQNEVCAGKLGDNILEGTTSTYWKALELIAPDDEGLHKWTLKCETPDSEYPHEIQVAPVVFRTAAPPEHSVEIKIVDQYEKRPLQDVHIMLGFYKGITDADGIARLTVPGGSHELRVSPKDYIPINQFFSIDKDQDIEVPLVFYPIL